MSAEAKPALAGAPAIRITAPKRFCDVDLRELWAYRELLYFFVWRDVKVRYKQTAIGAAWAILQPLMTTLVFTLFFGKLAHIPSNGLPGPIFYFTALLPWTYFATSLQSATNTVVDHQYLITKVYFPRIMLPATSVLAGLVDFAVGFVFLMAMTAYYGIRPSWALLLAPLFLLLAVLTALGVGLWFSALNAMYRDMRYIVPFVIQFWMFASPVAYPSSLVPARWRWIYGLNPMAGVIEGFRWSIAGRGDPPGRMLWVSIAAVIAVLAGGLAYFQRIESTVADFV
jgi:lipopolysaccharide transport system permease protein